MYTRQCCVVEAQREVRSCFEAVSLVVRELDTFLSLSLIVSSDESLLFEVGDKAIRASWLFRFVIGCDVFNDERFDVS